MKPIPLRPHHGMCLAFYQGYGYSRNFNDGMYRMLEQLLGNPHVRLTLHGDMVCAGCPHQMGQDCETERRTRSYDRAVLRACHLQEAQELPFLDFVRLIQTRILAKGLRSRICGDCQWSPLCDGRSRWSDLETLR